VSELGLNLDFKSEDKPKVLCERGVGRRYEETTEKHIQEIIIINPENLKSYIFSFGCKTGIYVLTKTEIQSFT